LSYSLIINLSAGTAGTYNNIPVENKTQDSKSFQAELNDAVEGFDFKGLAQKAITALGKSENDLAEAIDQVTDLGTQLAVQQANRGDNSIIVTIDKKQYKLIGNRFSFKGKPEMNAEALSKDKDQLKFMLESGSGSLIPVK
jgi:hypothetical protein